MLGLSHAFLYAGAQRVVASLWKVEDSATAKLMEYFYRGLYKQRDTRRRVARRANRDAPRSAMVPAVLLGVFRH
jgi:hypothetical protein